MATTDVRSRLSQIAFKVESTVGTDSIAGTPAAGDYVTCDATIRFTQDTTPNPVQTGSYDSLPPIPGALRAEIQVTLMMVGSGTAGTAPAFASHLRACGLRELVFASPAIVEWQDGNCAAPVIARAASCAALLLGWSCCRRDLAKRGEAVACRPRVAHVGRKDGSCSGQAH